MKKMPNLLPGDIVDIVSPGSPSRPEDLEKALGVLRSWDLVPRFPNDSLEPHPFHSNFDSVRFQLLKSALQAKDSKAIWCLRGGYGSNRLIPELCKMKKPLKAKLLLGYSDITTLHTFLQQNWKWSSWHSPTVESLSNQKLSNQQIEEMKSLLFGFKKQQEFHLKPMNDLAKKKSAIQGMAIGGNLTVLASTIGSKVSLKTQGKILILEDIGERGYRIDRHLWQLQLAGSLKGCRAVIFGDFTGGAEPDGKDLTHYAIDRFAAEIGVPCFQGLEMGHGQQNRVVPLGVISKIQANRWVLPTLMGK